MDTKDNAIKASELKLADLLKDNEHYSHLITSFNTRFNEVKDYTDRKKFVANELKEISDSRTLYPQVKGSARVNDGSAFTPTEMPKYEFIEKIEFANTSIKKGENFLLDDKYLEKEYSKYLFFHPDHGNQNNNPFISKERFSKTLVDYLKKGIALFLYENWLESEKELSSNINDNLLQKKIFVEKNSHHKESVVMILKDELTITTIYNEIKKFLSDNEHSQLLDLLQGKKINQRLTFGGDPSQLSGLWGAIKRDPLNYTSLGPEKIKRWIVENFNDTHGKQFSMGTVKKYYLNPPQDKIAAHLFHY